MTENQATTRLLSNLKKFGFFWKAADRFTSGIPDIIGCYHGRFIAIEMKVDRGKPTPLQLYNLEQIRKNEGYAAVITYSNREGTWHVDGHAYSMQDLITHLIKTIPL